MRARHICNNHRKPFTRKADWVGLIGIVFLCGILLSMTPANAEVRVFLDFTRDVDNGPPAGGGGNSTADWIENLDDALVDAGFAASTGGERTAIQAAIKSSIESSYSAFDITFSTTTPTAPFHTINFGATTTDSPMVGPFSFGVAPLDFRNLSATQTANVYSHNFDFFFVDGGDTKAQFITEMQAALAGTGAHELGHSLGLQHHHAYSDPGITPTNYAATGGLQNQYIIATGSTGITEAQRETQRGFSVFENVILEAASSLPPAVPLPSTAEDDFSHDVPSIAGVNDAPIATAIATGGGALTSNPLIATVEELDAGGTAPLAQALTLTSLPISMTKAAMVVGAMLDSDTDVDYYSFPGKAGNLLTAQVFSEDRYLDEFDGELTLFDTDGTSVLATNDDVRYNGNVFNAGTLREKDPFLLNIALPSNGTFFLKVEAAAAGTHSGDLDGAYDLIFAIPEPGTVGMLVLGVVSLLSQRRRRGK